MMYGSPFYGGIMPYAYPTPAAAPLPGSDSIAKDDKAATPALPGMGRVLQGAGGTSLPPRVRSRPGHSNANVLG